MESAFTYHPVKLDISFRSGDCSKLISLIFHLRFPVNVQEKKKHVFVNVLDHYQKNFANRYTSFMPLYEMI